MIETKIFCDKCRKEIKCIPPGPDSSVITLEGEKHFEMVEGAFCQPQEHTIFDDYPKKNYALS